MRSDWERAARAGDLEVLIVLAASGVDVDARDRYGQTALMLAARGGHTDVVRWLAAHGADLNHSAKFGLTALMLAVVFGRGEAARALIEAGAALEPRGTGAPGFSGKTALDLARGRGDADLVALMEPRSSSPRQRP